MNPDDAYNYCKLFPFHSLHFVAVEDQFSIRDWRTHMVRAPLKPGVIVADPHAQFPFLSRQIDQAIALLLSSDTMYYYLPVNSIGYLEYPYTVTASVA